MQPQQYLIANWKMNGSCAELGEKMGAICNFVEQVPRNAKVVVCPPDVHIMAAKAMVADLPIAIGGQNLSRHNPAGAYTGEVSAYMLRDAGCDYVIVGHSERRVMHRETNEVVAEKFAAATEENLVPVLCLGEHQSERHSGDAERVVDLQLGAVFARMPKGELRDKNWIVAYEPVWAIGSGVSASPQEAEEMHAFIRRRVNEHIAGRGDNMSVLYGGSISAENAANLFAMPNVDGGLVGSSSLHPEKFLSICKSINGEH